MIDSRRRWFGLLFLLLSAGMLIWGQTWLRPHLQGAGFVLYWMVCLGWTLLALLTALWDLRVTRLRARQEQLEMLRRTLGDGEVTRAPGKNGRTKVRRRRSD